MKKTPEITTNCVSKSSYVDTENNSIITTCRVDWQFKFDLNIALEYLLILKEKTLTIKESNVKKLNVDFKWLMLLTASFLKTFYYFTA